MMDILQKLDENLQLVYSYQEDNHLTFILKLVKICCLPYLWPSLLQTS
jgi:hypothetical protein